MKTIISHNKTKYVNCAYCFDTGYHISYDGYQDVCSCKAGKGKVGERELVGTHRGAPRSIDEIS